MVREKEIAQAGGAADAGHVAFSKDPCLHLPGAHSGGHGDVPGGEQCLVFI